MNTVKSHIKATLIITTYNWPEALRKVLDSVGLQVELPHEVIIADDGSDSITSDLINLYQAKLPCSLVHSWQEDKGFRLALSRNRAIAKSTGNYIIFVDGDTMLNPHFVKDHKKAAQKGTFSLGKRAYINELVSNKILKSNSQASALMYGLGHRDQAFRLPFLPTYITEVIKNYTNRGMGGNCAFWKDDIIKANGYNNNFEGWGPEDNEFCQRLINLGLKPKKLRFKATCFHIHHKLSSKQTLEKNQQIFEKTISEQLSRCENGLDQV